MQLKKFTAFLLSSSILVSVLVGCGGTTNSISKESEDTTKQTVAEATKKKDVTLTYGIWDKNQEPTMRQISDAFEKINPNIKIKIELTPYKQYWTKMETSATGGTLPDVLWMNGPRFMQYAKANMLSPITKNLEKDKVNLADFPESLIKLYTYNDEKYAIPKDWDTTALWFNKQLFDDAKVPYPDGTWDWNKMREVAKQLTDTSKGIYGIAAAQDDVQVGYYNTILQAGGNIISEDRKKSGYGSVEAAEGVQCWMDLINDGSSPTIQQMADSAPTNLFESGKVAMLYQASWMISEFMQNEYTKDKVDLVVMPQIKKKGAVIHGIGNVISSKTKNPEEAWQFASFLGSKEANELQAKSGSAIPAYKPVLNIFLESHKNINLKAFVDELDYSTMYPSSLYTSKWNDVETTYFKKIWTGEMTAADACKKLAEEMDAILATEK